ncbi:MAG: class I SAM-dependent methyltransferase [Chloroflexi bacterium]|nr:class I SAM-dependent methyltransferase [Chloroflexota bacterium]
MNQNLAKQKEYWDREVGEFDSIYSHGKSKFDNWIDVTFRWDMYARFEYTLKHAEPIAGQSFLDVGCGTGRYALELARRGASRVVGIDIAEKMIEVCSRRSREERLDDRCSFLQSDLLQYLAAAKFDVVIGIGLFDYIGEPLPVFTKMRQVVTDRAIISLPRFWTWRAPVRKVRLALRGCDVFFYTKERIAPLLKQAGFSHYEIEQVGQLYCVTAFV